MRCTVHREPRETIMIADVSELKRADSPETVMVPAQLLNLLQRAQYNLNRAEAAVLRSLADAGTATEEQLRWLADLDADMMT